MSENLELEKTLWSAADKLRSNMDAAEYKHVVLGLIFLKYISDAFDELYQKLVAEKDKTGADPEDKDEYTAERVFYVPPSARWKWLQGRAKLPTIGKDIDDAMDAIEKDNPSLKGVLSKDYARPALDKQRLGELIDLIGSITLSNNSGKGKDVLGFVFEYFLGQFADAEGKKGGQFYTPQSIVKLLVEVLAPEAEKRVYDGCCGSGGMFVQSERFIELHEHRKGKISIYGQESNSTTYKLAKMNLAIRGIDAKIELGDTFINDKFPDLKVDYILANPPFNVSDYSINKSETHKWKYGIPPTGNANYAWLQHFISKLAPNGTAGIVLANGSMSSDIATEGQIRKELIENDLVDCMVALPAQLFYNTQIPACLWFLSRNKTNHNFRNRSNEILFIDARDMGTMISRRQKELTEVDIQKIGDAYHNWRSKEWQEKYKDIPGFCKSANIQEIRKNNYILTPGRYIDFIEAVEDGQAFDDKMKHLSSTLKEQMQKAASLDQSIKDNLKKIGDRNTQAVFGNYVDIYDIQQAVEDKATVPIFYESRLAKVNFAEDEKVNLDEQFEELTEGEELTQRQQLRAKWTRLEAIVGNENRINKIAEDLVYHFEQRSSVLDGKAMVVCMSRRICVEMYEAIIKLRPLWHSDDDDKGSIKIVMTGSSSDELKMQPHIRNKQRRKAIGERLKNPNDSLKIAIVRDMWLTGFDAPCLHTLYIDKPMRGHSLMQAIARVNRVFREDKEGGLVVDYLGIAQELKQALADYTASGGEGKPTLDQELAVAKMLEYYEAIEYQLRHFDWQKFFTLTPHDKLKYIPLIVDYIFSQENGEQSFTENTQNLLKAFAISVPHEKAIRIRDNVALFQAIKARLVKISDRNETGKSNEEIETAIKQIISEAITADKVIDIFDAAGIKKPSIEILDERFLEELKNLPQKNLAVELLKKLLKEEIKKRTKINLVESKKFSEMLEDAIKRYHNGMIDTVEFLEKVLIPFAAQIKASDKRGENLGLDFREYAFYTALEVNNSAVAILGDETLKHIAQELLKTVRNNSTIDWTIKESVQSALRRNIRRILRLHGYPPDLQEKAVETVIEQAKMLAEDLTNE